MDLDFLNRFSKGHVWSIGVYVEDGDFSFRRRSNAPRFVLDSKKRRTRQGHVHTYADPFLFPHHGELYLFFESQAVSEHGKIEAYKTADLTNFEYVGEILKEPFHLSFPFVFSNKSSVYLIPETWGKNEVALYKFEEFPNAPVRLRTLLTGSYRDSSLFKQDGVWFLFTTSDDGLEIFYTDDLESGNLLAHHKNPITNDPRYARCGGSLVSINNDLYRIAQDGSSEYGKNINIMRVKELSKTNYDEEVFVEDYFDFDHSWNSKGGHHLSLANFDGKTVVAVDGKQFDLLMNKFLAFLHKL